MLGLRTVARSSKLCSWTRPNWTMMSGLGFIADALDMLIPEFSQRWHRKASLEISQSLRFWMRTTSALIWLSIREERTRETILRKSWWTLRGGVFKLMAMGVRILWELYLKKARREHIFLHVSPRVQRISDYMLVIISSQLLCINFWCGFKLNSGPVMWSTWIHTLWIYLLMSKKFWPCFRFNLFLYQQGLLKNWPLQRLGSRWSDECLQPCCWGLHI